LPTFQLGGVAQARATSFNTFELFAVVGVSEATFLSHCPEVDTRGDYISPFERPSIDIYIPPKTLHVYPKESRFYIPSSSLLMYY